ncbi:hypothetical protein TSUD_376530 [Trifolium subterraneum]|uniref:SWIM-type domain-containing protein n=1 Tax=Trifolium subterraneum TaxID=3900 RepID=A0A2Z6NCL9_TRISU|nr:hypothetical protein TSUD_376530 [Trifolium subterraneum]
MLKSKNNSKNKKSDKIHYIRYVCIKEGFKKGSLLNPNNKTRSDSPVVIEFEKVKERPEERIGCKARIHLKLDEALNVYKIYRWEGITIIHYIEKSISVTSEHSEKSWRHKESPFSVFGLKELFDDNSFKGDDEGWNYATGLDYSLFGDVISFDTTYRKNNQYRPLAAFIGFDNHRRSVLFGAALLYDEMAATFDWLFTTFLKCMSNKKPQTIYIDQATALLKSVPNIFQDVFHGLCSWHMSENAKKNLGSRANSSFFVELTNLISNVDDESNFDYNWDQMMKFFFYGRPISNWTWLVQTHRNRMHWSSAWVKSHFTAGLKTTQLSESFNAFLRGFLLPDHSLVQFYSHFNIMVQRMRDNHADLDFKAANTITKNNYPNTQLMRSVVKKYTPASFAFIHRQYDMSFKYYYQEDTSKGSELNKFFKVFTIEKVDDPDEVDDHNDDDADNDNSGASNSDKFQEIMSPSFEDLDRLDERVVTVDIRTKSFSCTCRMFENMRFLCRHVFKILEFLGGSMQYHCLKTIPAQYVLKRWTRDVRPSVDKLKSSISVGTEDTTRAQQYQQICVVTIQLSTRVCADSEASQIFLDGVLEAGKKAEELLFSKGIGTNPSSVTPFKSSKAIVVVGEPSSGKSTAPKFKERPNPIKSKKRLKSDYEKARERQKFIIERKKQKREDEEALKKKVQQEKCKSSSNVPDFQGSASICILFFIS